MAQEMETFAARLASFDLVLNPGKRRSSSTKSAKRIAWPHRKPSPAELAHAGFFYNPYETNPDNTACFMCRNALDGWEEDDNPITEHLKHAKDCGWAVMMDIQQHSSNPAEIDDPTSDRIRDARLATFGTQWPHDGKRGWVCDSEKMVDGGWYFCPTEESNDLASCAYCKLSLDGWEPQDDPFNEHYRRSPDCSFFVFAQAPGKKGKGKGTRAKRGRPSKASLRMSTQSTASEAPVSDMEEMTDLEIGSQASTKTKSTKKSSKSKSKTRSKKEDLAETGSQMDIDEPELVPQEPPKQKRTRGKKRTSDDVEQEEQSIRDMETSEQPERPSKKRATKTRNSAQQGGQGYESVAESQQDDSILQEEETQKSRAAPKKRGRKPSSASTSKAASVSRVPRDSEIDAALEADLEINETEPIEVKPKPEPKKKSTSTKSKSKKKQKATPEPELMDTMDDHIEDRMPEPAEEEEVDVVEEPKPKKAAKSSKRGKTRNSNNSDTEQKQLDSTKQSDADQSETAQSERMSVEVETQEPKAEPEQELAEKTTKKSLKKKASAEKGKKSKKAEKAAPEPSAAEEQREEHAEQEVAMEDDATRRRDEQHVKQESYRRRSSKVPPKTAKRLSDIPQEKLYARSLAGSRYSDAHSVLDDDNHPTKEQDHEAVSPLPSASKSTPSLSPQSSDAENHPPSMKPAPRPHLGPSPSKEQPVRVPLAPSTPSPSKRNANGGISTSHPWKPIDIDELILANSSDPENIDFSSALNSIKGDLTSPEKKMNVEEWIGWHAKNGEERLKRECERLVGQFEREGARAMRVLEGIECID